MIEKPKPLKLTTNPFTDASSGGQRVSVKSGALVRCVLGRWGASAGENTGIVWCGQSVTWRDWKVEKDICNHYTTFTQAFHTPRLCPDELVSFCEIVCGGWSYNKVVFTE